MKKGVLSLILVLTLFILPLVLAESIDEQIKKITHYAEEYETGNIDYVKLLIYTGTVREKMNELLGVVSREQGGLLKQEQIRSVLGEPSETTKWVWVEEMDGGYEVKLDKEVPVWRKIIFDGKKIQIRMEAFPSIFKKGAFGDKDDRDFEDRFEDEIDFDESGRALIYRLHFEIEFKKLDEQLDVNGMMTKIKGLAEVFNSDSSQENAENLAKESVNAEMAFQNYFRQSGKQCTDLMNNIFGSEYKREVQEILEKEIEFYSGDNFDVIVNLNMCENCEWQWIDLNFWVDQRGGGFFGGDKEEKGMTGKVISAVTGFVTGNDETPEDNKEEMRKEIREEFVENIEEFDNSKEREFEEKEDNMGFDKGEKFKSMTNEDFKNAIREEIENARRAAEEGKPKKIMEMTGRIRELNQAWNEQSNNVWEEVDKEFNKDFSEEGEHDPYFWIEKEKEKRVMVKNLMNANYNERKSFYLSLFPNGKTKISKEEGWEKRLIEEFREFGKEICDNNEDDNGNEQTDCEEDQCVGRFAGNELVIVGEGEEAVEKEVKLYCTNGERKPKEEIEEKKAVCGDGIISPRECEFLPVGMIEGEENEVQLYACPEDCENFITCPEIEPIQCDGIVKQIEKDENDCVIELGCFEDEESCQVDSDCSQPLCGVAKCVIEDEVGKCEIEELTECEDGCTPGEEEVKECDNDLSIVTKFCTNEGIWQETGKNCEGEIVIKNKGSKLGCNSVSDCPNNHVCSNGECEFIPEKTWGIDCAVLLCREGYSCTQGIGCKPIPGFVYPEKQEKIKIREPEQEVVEESNEEGITGNVIFRFIAGLFTKSRITGFAVEEGGEVIETSSEPVLESSPEGDWSEEKCPDVPKPEYDRERCWIEERYDNRGCLSGYSAPICDNSDGGERQDESELMDDRRWEKEDRRDREKGCGDEAQEKCKEIFMIPCVDECVFPEGGGEPRELEVCKKECEGGLNLGDCVSKYVDYCKGDRWEDWEEYEMGLRGEHRREHKEEKGVFTVMGGCRTAEQKVDGHLNFGGWGDPFERIEPLKHKYYEREGDWCKWELENSIKEREEIEKGFNQEFAVWFFEKYLSNSAEDWELLMPGIFELYWRNVDNQRKLAERMKCLGKRDIDEVMDYNLINIKYESEYGRLEYWEEVKEVELPGMPGKVRIISPYMRTWVFPSKKFMISEMQRAMKNHEFPGPPEERMKRNNEEGPTAEEREMIKQDKKFMNDIRDITKNYGGSLDGVIQFVEPESGEIAFNLFAQVNEDVIMNAKPMPPEEVPQGVDVTIKIDFNEIYELIENSKKKMSGGHIESPPWDRKIQPVQMIKEVVNGVQMYFKMRSIIDGAEVSPESAKGDIKKLMKKFFGMMGKGDDKRSGPRGEGDEGSEGGSGRRGGGFGGGSGGGDEGGGDFDRK